MNVTYLLYVNHQMDQLDRKTSILFPLKALVTIVNLNTFQN